MNGWSALDDFLRTDPRDVGCAQAMEALHIYAELTAAGAPAEQRYPGLAAHLRACGRCGEDFEGLLAALHDETHRSSTAGRLLRPEELLATAHRDCQAVLADQVLRGGFIVGR